MLSTITNDTPLTLEAGLDNFKAVYMPARNYSKRTREEYESDLSDLISFLTARNLTAWQVVGLRDLQSYLADLTGEGLSRHLVTARPTRSRPFSVICIRPATSRKTPPPS